MKITAPSHVILPVLTVAALVLLSPAPSVSVAADTKRHEAKRYEAKRAKPRTSQAQVVDQAGNAAKGTDPATRSEGMQRFASCISASGAKFYGAHWCGYCKKQKALFGRAASSLPYIECSKPGSREKLPVCEEITGFPTWKFENGRTRGGFLTIDALASATGCDAP